MPPATAPLQLPAIRILALSGSLRRQSANSALLRACAAHGAASGGAAVRIVRCDQPLYDGDGEAAALASPASPPRLLRDAARACDAVLLAAPEYNHSFSPALGNALAWLSREAGDGPAPLARKPVALVSAAGYSGGMRGQAHLRDVLHYLKMPLLLEPEFTLNLFAPPRAPGAAPRFDAASGDVADELLRAKLAAVVDALVAWTRKLGHTGGGGALGGTKMA